MEKSCEAIGKRTRDSMSKKRSQGQRVGRIPYGYRLAADCVHLEEDPDERAVLAEIRQLRREGASLHGIADALNQRGIPDAAGNRVASESVVRVLIKARRKRRAEDEIAPAPRTRKIQNEQWIVPVIRDV